MRSSRATPTYAASASSNITTSGCPHTAAHATAALTAATPAFAATRRLALPSRSFGIARTCQTSQPSSVSELTSAAPFCASSGIATRFARGFRIASVITMRSNRRSWCRATSVYMRTEFT